MIKKGSIIKRVNEHPLKVEIIGLVEAASKKEVKIKKGVISVNDKDHVNLNTYGNVCEPLEQCHVINSGADFDIIYDIIGRGILL